MFSIMRSSSEVGIALLLAGLLCGAVSAAKADSVVVFNEIMYHPGTNVTGSEWLELHNQMAVDVDLSGWSIAGGVAFTFAEGTVISGRGYLVVALSPADLAAATGLTNVLGPYTGHLSHTGEKLDLHNRNQRLMDSVTYGVGGAWPVGPDGSGVSLAKKDEDSASGPAASWTVSALVGGSPGRINFPLSPFEVTNTTPTLLNSTWKYQASGQDLGSAWRQPTYDDSAWSAAPSPFQAGTLPAFVGDPVSLPTVFSTGVGPDGTVLAPGLPDPHYWLTLSAQSRPPPPAIPATVIQNHPAWLGNDTRSSWIGAVNPGTANVAAGDYNFRTTFSLTGYDTATAALTMSVGADNRLTNVFLNGVSHPLITYVGFSSLSGSFKVTNGFAAGTNSLDFFTVNDDGPGPNPAGFRALLTGTARPVLVPNSTLATGLTDYYFRSDFILAGAPQLASLQLKTAIAGGAVFYLNGTEVLRLNMPAGPITAATSARTNATSVLYLGPFALPNSALVSGTNVLAVEVHPAADGTTNHIFFAADLSLSVTNILIAPPMPIAFNEVSPGSNGDFWFELINYGPTELDLAGCVLAWRGGATNNNYIFPSQVLAPGALVQVTQATLGFGVSAGDRLFLYGPGGSNVLDALIVPSAPLARWPDGAGAWSYPAAPTPGASNAFVFHRDVVINEIMYGGPVQQAQQSTESWVELFNRGSNTVDLTGWALGGGIGFSFAPGTTLGAGGHLVVANDVAFMQSNYPGIGRRGPCDRQARPPGFGHPDGCGRQHCQPGKLL
jgi:Lamin Tail Domain